MASDKYKYEKVPLSPLIACELILELFSGQTKSRQEITESVLAYHKSKGGSDAKAVDVTRSCIKKALNKLKEEGMAENLSYRFWRIQGRVDVEQPEEINDQSKAMEREAPFEDIRQQKEEINGQSQIFSPTGLQADLTVGEGKGAVYLYYLPQYKKAQENGRDQWQCKIGKSERDPMQRILEQVATALPEQPHLALVVKTDHASELERAIHNILTLRGRRATSALGKEWFLTSPDEVLEIVRFIFPEMDIPR